MVTFMVFRDNIQIVFLRHRKLNIRRYTFVYVWRSVRVIILFYHVCTVFKMIQVLLLPCNKYISAMNSNNDTDPKEAWINKVKERVEANTYSFYRSLPLPHYFCKPGKSSGWTGPSTFWNIKSSHVDIKFKDTRQ